MICNDQRIINICGELFHFLKSDQDSCIVHGKTCTKIARGKATFTEITIGFLTIRVLFVPYFVQDSKEHGSNEGASVFIYLPFSETGVADNSQRIEIKCYYSERGTVTRLVANVEDILKSTTLGPKRIVKDLKVTNNDPLS